MLLERAEFGEKAKEIIITSLRKDNLILDDSDKISDIGVDSLDFIELIFAVEEAFNIDIPFNANTIADENLDTVGDVIDMAYKVYKAGGNDA